MRQKQLRSYWIGVRWILPCVWQLCGIWKILTKSEMKNVLKYFLCCCQTFAYEWRWKQLGWKCYWCQTFLRCFRDYAASSTSIICWFNVPSLGYATFEYLGTFYCNVSDVMKITLYCKSESGEDNGKKEQLALKTQFWRSGAKGSLWLLNVWWPRTCVHFKPHSELATYISMKRKVISSNDVKLTISMAQGWIILFSWTNFIESLRKPNSLYREP